MKDRKHQTFMSISLSNPPDVDFSMCDLTGSYFQDCDLTGIPFRGAYVSSCTFVRCRIPIALWWDASVIDKNNTFRDCVGADVYNGKPERKCHVCARWCDVDAPCWWCGNR